MAVIPSLHECDDGDAAGEYRRLGSVQVSSPAPGLLAGAQTALLVEAPARAPQAIPAYSQQPVSTGPRDYLVQRRQQQPVARRGRSNSGSTVAPNTRARTRASATEVSFRREPRALRRA
jgi:hypothetical protein